MKMERGAKTAANRKKTVPLRPIFVGQSSTIVGSTRAASLEPMDINHNSISGDDSKVTLVDSRILTKHEAQHNSEARLIVIDPQTHIMRAKMSTKNETLPIQEVSSKYRIDTFASNEDSK